MSSNPDSSWDEPPAPSPSSPERARLHEYLTSVRNEHRPVKWQKRLEKLAQNLEETLATYKVASGQKRTLHHRITRQTLMLQLLDLEQRWYDQWAASPAPTISALPSQGPQGMRTPAGSSGPGAPSTSTAPPPGLPTPAAPAGPLKFNELPPSHGWDRTWEQRVLALTSRDLAHLHYEWLQHSALLMCKAKLCGHASSENQQLREYAERYAAFNQHLMRLIPAEWRRRSLYDLNTMTPTARTPDPAWMDEFLSTWCKSKPFLLQAFDDYHKLAKALREQCAALLEQYGFLLGMQALGLDWAATSLEGGSMTDAARPETIAAAAAARRAELGMKETLPARPAAVAARTAGVAEGAAAACGQSASAPDAGVGSAGAGVGSCSSQGVPGDIGSGRPPQRPGYEVGLPQHASTEVQPGGPGHVMQAAAGPAMASAPDGTYAAPAGFEQLDPMDGQGTAATPMPQLFTALLAGDGASGSRDSGAPDIVSSMDDLLRSISVNMMQQQLALRQCLFSARFSDDIVEHTRVYLLLYPLALDLVDFLEAAVGYEQLQGDGGTEGDICVTEAQGTAGTAGSGAATAAAGPGGGGVQGQKGGQHAGVEAQVLQQGGAGPSHQVGAMQAFQGLPQGMAGGDYG